MVASISSAIIAISDGNFTGTTSSANGIETTFKSIQQTFNNSNTTTTIITSTTTDVLNLTSDHCAARYEEFIIPESEIYCHWTWDTILCWPPTPAGTIIRQRCPPRHGIDVTKFAERRCGLDGRWAGKSNGSLSQQTVNGWTNYTPCFTPEIMGLLKKVYAGGNDDQAMIKLDIAERTRALEIVGFTVSLFALLLSLIIFCNFRSLRNNRTRIHKNLFVAMIIQVVIRLTLYLDQAIIRRGQEIAGIDNTPFLCEASYVFLEYARTAMFMWMFIEGLYLHNVVTVTVFQGRFPHRIYALIGWGAPIIMTTIWAIFTSRYMGKSKCWWNYNLTPYYWILEGPRLTVILLNFFFLLNIIRVLVVKLRQSHTSDIEQVRKAVRAAVVLLPLLGITNLLNMFEAPLDKSALEFGLWSYITYFLSSFQGLFIAMIYCFLNGEVRAALSKSVNVYLSLRGYTNWISMFSGGYNTAVDTEAQCNSINRQDSTSVQQTQTRFKRNSTHRNWMSSCFRNKKVLRKQPTTSAPPESVVFELSEP